MYLFGEAPIEPAELANRLISGADLSWESLKRMLYETCLRHEGDDQVVCCRKKGLPDGSLDVQEWLLDFVWLDKRRLAMKLAVECEWSSIPAQIRDDFEKLMSIKAPLKLFIYATDKIKNSRVQQVLSEYLRNFSQNVEGEMYLLMEVHDRRANFYTYRLPRNGSVPEVTFGPLPV